ncbi:tRNA dihydrouridine synthase DusB [Nannocystaceae bacterium ST9]
MTPIHIGPLELWPPIVLAPMAGVTDVPFRQLCRREARAGLARAGVDMHDRVPGLFVSEMITARPLLEGSRRTLRMSAFAPDEAPRSIQLYGIDPDTIGKAVARLVGEGLVDHVDLNFGCSVPKVTRRGGGAAIPAKPRLLAKIVGAAVRAAGSIPVTIKFRKGIDDALSTFRDAGRIAEQEGCAAVGLHARTAEQFYEGAADWDAIAELVALVRSIPVLGNGDIWEAHDAARMIQQTGCAGVIVGRGCLGRPWLFRELAELACGLEPSPPPAFGQVAEVMLEHAAAMIEWQRQLDELDPDPLPIRKGPVEPAVMKTFRKHAAWYTKGFRGSAALRERLMHVTGLAELAELLATCDADEPFPEAALRAVRGKRGRQPRVILPDGFRASLDDDTPPPPEAESADSGG